MNAFELEQETFEYFGPTEFQLGSNPSLDSAKHEVNLKGKAWRKWLKQSLTAAGAGQLSSDDKLDAKAVRALASFQKVKGIAATGLVDAATLQALKGAGASAEPNRFLERLGDQPA